MAKKSKVVQQQKLEKRAKYPVRRYNRCQVCGRSRGYMRRFGMCRICFRKYAHKGEISGVKKRSW